jgi:putative acetyltransferase
MSRPEPSIRWATPEDYAGLAEVMFDAVRNGPSRYSERQRERWVPAPREGAEWVGRLDRQEIALAQAPQRILGFMSLAPGGYVDFAYVRPEAQGSGLFRRLYAAIEQRAAEEGGPRLWVHASLMAQPAFAAVGFVVVEREQVSIGDETFERFVMEKRLPATSPEGPA